ncbi:MAG: helix-turn-helix transcriptional regulator [Nitrososphaerota archaeon]|nr:helix-turn-helix transcriptional regulator [Nitrososphaerota archaeon]
MPIKGSSAQFRVAGHPVRKRLVELLGARQALSFSELRSETGLPVGSLYYHLDVLYDIVRQDEGRRYGLTKKGSEIYDAIARKEGLPLPQRRTEAIPGWIFTRLSSHAGRSATVFALVTVAGCLLNLEGSSTIALMNFYDEGGGILAALSFPLSFSAYYLYTVAFAAVLHRRSFAPNAFLLAPVVYAPYLLYPVAAVLGGQTATDAALVGAQLASIVLGSAYTSSLFGLRLERSLLVQLVFFLVSTSAFFSVEYGVVL